jgi:molybdopterin synthase sulfur carrier subunit
MARVRVQITRLLADIAGADRITTVEAATAAEAVEALCAVSPALRVHVFDDHGEIRRHVNVFVRGEHTSPAALDTAVADGDEIALIQAVSGGAT